MGMLAIVYAVLWISIGRVVGGGLCLGAVMLHSGLAAWLVESLPLEMLGDYGTILVLSIVACTMSAVMSNTATANLMLPLAITLAGGAQSTLLIAIAFACSLAMPLPVSTPPNAMAFSTGQLTTWSLLVPGLLITVIGVALMLTVGVSFWRLVGL